MHHHLPKVSWRSFWIKQWEGLDPSGIINLSFVRIFSNTTVSPKNHISKMQMPDANIIIKAQSMITSTYSRIELMWHWPLLLPVPINKDAFNFHEVRTCTQSRWFGLPYQHCIHITWSKDWEFMINALKYQRMPLVMYRWSPSKNKQYRNKHWSKALLSLFHFLFTKLHVETLITTIKLHSTCATLQSVDN